jgi:superfamily II DNA or RNA helicase
MTRHRPTVVLSDDAEASRKIKRFSEDQSPWIIACNMVSEGVDIPRLRIGVYATTIRTKMYFRQFIGRLVRSSQLPAPSKGSAISSPAIPSPIAYCYLPADPTLKQLAFEIETEIKHSIRHRDDDEQFAPDNERVQRETPPETTWEILDSTNDGLQSVIVHGTAVSGAAVSGAALSGAVLQAAGVFPNPDSLFNSEYEAARGGKSTMQLSSGESPLARQLELQNIIQEQVSERLTQKRAPTETKAALTREIRRLVTVCNRRLHRSHAAIYGQLNALQGIASQHSCSETELRKRIALLNDMLRGA